MMSLLFALGTLQSQQVNEEVIQEVACIMRPLAMQRFWTSECVSALQRFY